MLEKMYKVEVIFTTVKEKFGTLRIYYKVNFKPSDFKQKDIEEHIEHFIDLAVLFSGNICEDCGDSGRLRTENKYNLITLCDKCQNKKEK